MELYHQYHQPLYHAAYNILKNRDDVQDAMQEGMIVAFEKLNQFQGEGDFGGWLRKIVVRKSIAYYHYNKRITRNVELENRTDPSEDPEKIDIELRGKATEASCQLTGSGDIKADEMESYLGSAKVTGSEDIELHASSDLTANVTGSGDIICSGNPKKQQIKTTGSGDVIVRD